MLQKQSSNDELLLACLPKKAALRLIRQIHLFKLDSAGAKDAEWKE